MAARLSEMLLLLIFSYTRGIVVSEGDFVLMHNVNDRLAAQRIVAVDIFRVEDGK